MSFKVQLRGGFADRKGLIDINKIIQLKSFDERTRTVLSNETLRVLNNILDDSRANNSKFSLANFTTYLFTEVLLLKEYQIPKQRSFYGGPVIDYNAVLKIIDDIITNNSYEEVLTLIESICLFYRDYYKSIVGFFNNVFEKECVGYRVIDNQITDITSEKELTEIQQVIESKYNSCSKHIQKAIKLLYDRKKPDYENSIKESITAVEAMCQIILNNNKPTLGEALKLLEKNGFKIHSALKDVFNKLYGYTSDENGVRHAGGLGDISSTFEEAKYMLISCSAFVNYLTCVYEKSKV